jgi:hypothetical protein
MFQKWVRMCNSCHFEPGLSHSTWWSSVPYIFQKITSFHFLLWLSNIPFMYYIIHYIHNIDTWNISYYSFINFWAPRLIPLFSYCEQNFSRYGMQISLLYIDLHSFDICSRVVWQGHKVGLFLVFLRKFCIDFHSGYTSFHSHQQCVRVSFSPHLTNICCLFSWWLSIWLG